MPTSAPGSLKRQPPRPVARAAGARGLTLLELLVVASLIALVSAGASFALRDSGRLAVEQDALRLAAWLNAAHAQARATGAPVTWRAEAGGLRLGQQLHPWGQSDTRLSPAQGTLWPEPVQPPQALRLQRGQHHVRVASDGVRPFALQRDEPHPAP